MVSRVVATPVEHDREFLDQELQIQALVSQAARHHLADVWFALPLPPSSNNQYVTVRRTGRRIASLSLRQFKLVAQQSLRYLYRLNPSSPPWTTASHIGYQALIIVPTWRSDLSNRLKAAEDVVADFFGFNDRTVTDVRVIKRVGKGYGPPRIIFHWYVLACRAEKRKGTSHDTRERTRRVPTGGTAS
jgi:hypothetical protein